MNLLTVNTGSSTVKAALYTTVSGVPERIDSLNAPLAGVTDSAGSATSSGPLEPLFEWLGERRPQAVGHRLVHGGPRHRAPEMVREDVLADLRRLIPIDPTHLPQAILAVEQLKERFPEIPQVACFDTYFHSHMPRVAQMYPLARNLREAGIMRFGFHGLSCEYVMSRLSSLDPEAAGNRVIIAHLGNGSSMTAVEAGSSVDTTMGFTPTGGLVMGTRSGDLDPGVLVYLVAQQGFDAQELSRLVNNDAGLLAISEISADMRELLEQEINDYRAEEAVELYCYQARKFLGALAAVMGGVDTIVFTGGIGEHAHQIRARICQRLEFLGVVLDEALNSRCEPVISASSGNVTVRVIPTDEDLIIAQHTLRLVTEEG